MTSSQVTQAGDVKRANWLELFFDLVFVYAIAKATHTIAGPHDGQISAQYYGLFFLIIIPVWWARNRAPRTGYRDRAEPRFIPVVTLLWLPPLNFRMVLDLASKRPGRTLASGFVILASPGLKAFAAALAFARARALAFVMTGLPFS